MIPYTIRDMELKDVPACKAIVEQNWGKEIADNAEFELLEMFSTARWPPHYLVAEGPVANGEILGFAGYKPAWLMSNAFEMVWINVAEKARGQGIGRLLTQVRVNDITQRGGTMVLLMSKKPAFFGKFGFKTVVNLDGWDLMVLQLAPIILADRSI